MENIKVKTLIIRLLLSLPILYIAFGWYIGLSYGSKSITFGPYPDIPVAVKTGLMGIPLEYISGAKAMMMVVPLKDVTRNTEDTAYFKRRGYFEVPGTWKFDFATYRSNYYLKKPIVLTGSLSRAICYDSKNTYRNIGNLSVEDLNDFLIRTGRIKDVGRLKSYFFIARLEKRYPWLYSETVLVSRAMGNIFKENSLPYDVLGLFGIVVLFIAFGIRSFYLWLYYLYWVFAYWFGRIGYHDPTLSFTREGWHIILWSFWHGFILEEGRLFLVIALGLSVMIFGILGIMHICRQIPSFLKGDHRVWRCEN